MPGKPANRCPACHGPMPFDRGPLRSDHAMKDHDETKITSTAGLRPLRIRGAAYESFAA